MSITKAVWLSATQCRKQAWHTMRANPQPPSESARFRMQQGQEIGELARTFLGPGVLVQAEGNQDVYERTQALTAEEDRPLFEAAFRDDLLVAKADGLIRLEAGWHVVEVKSSFSDTNKMADLIDDLAYTVMVARSCGLEVRQASLLLLSRDYRHGDNVEGLFEFVDQTAAVDAVVATYEGQRPGVIAQLAADNPPAARLVKACKDCDYFKDTCLGNGVDHTVWELPRLGGAKLDRLSDAGVVSLLDTPADLDLTDTQARVLQSVRDNEPFVGPDLRQELDQVQWPCHYLDFETVATVLPLYPGGSCHDQVLTQYSIHTSTAMGQAPTHTEFLADAEQEQERELSEALIEALQGDGSVLVYSSFEKQRLNALADRFEDLAAPIHQIVDRLVDLCAVISKNVYHPGFKGSFSIKKVLPVMVPGLGYGDLAVADGDTAIMQFARMARGEIDGEQAAATRQALLAYCERDTLAMVRLHEAMEQLCAERYG